MKVPAILLWVPIVAVVTAVPDPLQHVLQKVEQLERSNEAMKKYYDEKIASLEQQLKWGRNLSPESGKIFLKFFQSIYPYRISKTLSVNVNCLVLSLFSGSSGGVLNPVNRRHEY